MSTTNNKQILLVHPLGYKSDNVQKDISRLANVMPPLGLISVSAYLEKYGIANDIIDYYAFPNSDDRLQDYIKEKKPSFIGFSCSTATFLDGVRIGQLAKSVDPTIKTVFGGPHVSALKQVILERFPDVDFVVVGEGEQTMRELIEAEGQSVQDIGGLVYRDGDDVIFNGYRKDALNLDTLPFPAYEKLEGYPEMYSLPIFNYPRRPNSSCVTSRGCPYACSYCDRSVFQRSFRFNSAEYMYEHMSYLKQRFGIRHLNFYDDQFTFNRKRIEDFCTMITDRPLGMTFNCAVRAEHIDLDLLKQMKAAGCWMASLGIETGDPNLLAQHRQNADLDMVAEKLRLMKKAGIRTKGLLMMGLPGETEESIQRSMKYVFSQPIDDFNLAKFTPFPGSPLYENIEKFGTFKEDWAKMDCMDFLFVPNGISRERMNELFQLFYKTHFLQTKVLLDYVAMIWKSPDSWKRFLCNAMDFIRFARSNKRYGD